MSETLRPLSDFSREDRRRIRVVLTDIDDTLTSDGRLPAKAYAALEALQKAGFVVAPITGRPAGWCDLIARQWPVDGVVGENGAFYFRYDAGQRRMIRRYIKTAEERRLDSVRLAAIREAVLVEVAGSAVASDQAYREADLAIDFCEDVPRLPKAEVNDIVEIFARFGATAKVSSIHVNGWFGGYDKLSTTRLLLSECFDIDIDAERRTVVFCGDSPNDAPMFGFFPCSVGVANVREFKAELAAAPAFVAAGRGGEGFAEIAASLIEARL